MGNQKTLQLKCEKCDHIWDVDTWQVINEQEDSEAVDLLCNGLFFFHECPNCHTYYRIEIPTFYVDTKNKAMICFIDSILGITEMTNIINRYAKDLGVSTDSAYLRVTSSINEFREKVMLFKDGLDDRVIEILKLWALDAIREDGYNQQFEDIRCGINPENNKICIDFVGQNPRHIDLERDFYNEFSDGFIEILDKESTPLEVNADWAIKYVEMRGL